MESEQKASDPKLAEASQNSTITGAQISYHSEEYPQLQKKHRNKINNLIRIAQWNLRGSKHPSKIQTINIIDFDIFTLQEINHIDEQTVNKINTQTIISRKEREKNSKGGGTMTLSNLNITKKEEITINKDSTLTRLVIDGVFVLWLGNIYLNRGPQNK